MIKRILLGAAAVILLTAGFIIVQHSYDMTEESITISTPMGSLSGTLVMPKNAADKVGLIVMVHGDGPVNASYQDGYKPLWETFAKAGYATLSMSKPGIDGSEGNWLEQSMEDRALEAGYILDWAKSLPMVDTKRMGLWGSSQGGWVIPKLVESRRDIAFSILVSPAINWITQGRYNTRAELQNQNVPEPEIAVREAEHELVLKLLLEQADYQEYRRTAGKNPAISRDRWSFIQKNLLSDSTEELLNFRNPVHLILGGRDLNVDVSETERVYRRQIPPGLLTVTMLPDADHAMLDKEMAPSKLKTYLTAVFFPRRLCDPLYYQSVLHFLRSME